MNVNGGQQMALLMAHVLIPTGILALPSVQVFFFANHRMTVPTAQSWEYILLISLGAALFAVLVAFVVAVLIIWIKHRRKIRIAHKEIVEHYRQHRDEEVCRKCWESAAGVHCQDCHHQRLLCLHCSQQVHSVTVPAPLRLVMACRTDGMLSCCICLPSCLPPTEHRIEVLKRVFSFLFVIYNVKGADSYVPLAPLIEQMVNSASQQTTNYHSIQ